MNDAPTACICPLRILRKVLRHMSYFIFILSKPISVKYMTSSILQIIKNYQILVELMKKSKKLKCQLTTFKQVVAG